MRNDRETAKLLMSHSKQEFREEVINEIYDDFEIILQELKEEVQYYIEVQAGVDL